MTSDRKTILIVDDTPAHIEVLIECLKQDYATKVALEGEGALQLANSDPLPDLILLDVMMLGDLDGYNVCSRLKASERTRDIPVIFTTALGSVEDESHGFALGAVDYIAKPFNITLVKARVKTQLELKSYRDGRPVTVGTLVTERPPHRSVRAQLTHTAPTLGSGAKPLFRVGMNHPAQWDIHVNKTGKARPRHTMALTATE